MLAIFSANPRNEYDRDELIKVREMKNHASSGLKVESDHSGVVASGTESHAQTSRKMGKKIDSEYKRFKLSPVSSLRLQVGLSGDHNDA